MKVLLTLVSCCFLFVGCKGCNEPKPEVPVPADTKDVPADAKDVPTDVKPADTKDVPADAKDVPTEVKPTDVKKDKDVAKPAEAAKPVDVKLEVVKVAKPLGAKPEAAKK